LPSAGEMLALSSKKLMVRTRRPRSFSSGTSDRSCGFGELNVAARTRTLPNCLIVLARIFESLINMELTRELCLEY